MQIGIYGGRFDPIHLGHLICAEMVRDAFRLDKVLLVTSASPPHRAEGTPAAIRHRMVEAACRANPDFEACDLELRREGPSRSYDTVRQLQLECPEDEFSLLTSSEYLDPVHPWNLTRWYRGPELLQCCRLLAFLRPGHTLQQARAWADALGARVELLEDCPSPPLSSTAIRERIRMGQSVRYLVLPEVWDCIVQEGLYR